MSHIVNSIKIQGGGGSNLNYYYEEYNFTTNFNFSYGSTAVSNVPVFITRIGNTVQLYVRGSTGNIWFNSSSISAGYLVSTIAIPAKFLSTSSKIYSGVIAYNNAGTSGIIGRVYISSPNGLITIQPNSATNFNAGSFDAGSFNMSWVIEN